MSGDYSRDSFDTLRNFAGVFLQQGRAVLDSDWNELVKTFDRRIRAETVDIIGRAVVPRETEHAFEVRLIPDGFEFGRGRMYVDGMLAESFGWADFDGTDSTRPAPVMDRGRPGDDGPEGVLDEMISPLEGDYTSYFNQPYWPTPADLPDGGPHLVYLVVWQREVTPTEMPELLEPALGGLDTTTRWQTVWQVRVLGNVGDGATCQTPDDNLAGWIDAIAPSTARLSTGTVDVEDPEDPCLVPPTEGYTGLENQFYRVEIHDLFDPETASDPPVQGDWGFKFSRENASVRASVNSIAPDAESVTVARIGRDEVLRFRPGDWVEITDNHREFNHRSGQMLRVADVDPETREIEFEAAIDADLVPTGVDGDTVTARRTRLIRWDQRGIVRLDNGTQWADLDAEGSNGLIRVPPNGNTIVLESGITVTFSTEDGPGRCRQMDHWRFAARTAGTQVEILRAAPPDGVQRHHARLAVVTPDGPNTVGEVLDCRTFWPPLFEGGGEGCACTVCVTAEGHNSGALTIQAAIEQVGVLGGTVCLEAGIYVLSEPVEITGRGAITLSGQGLGTILAYRGDGGAVRVTRSADVRLERFTILAAPGSQVPVHGVAAINTMLLELRRLAVVIAAPNPEDRADFGIALDGTQVGTKVEECLAIAPNALGSRSSYGLDVDGDLQFAAFAELRVFDCILFGGRAGVLIERSAINIAAAILSRNLVLSLGVGVRINWAEIPAASLSVDASTVVANRTGVIVSAGTMRVQDCEISGGEEAGDGITLAPNILPQTLTSGQIIGNTIYDLADAGIRISAAHDTLFIKRNIIRDTGSAGVMTDPAATVRHLAVDNNAIERIGIDTGGSSIGIGLTSVESAQVVGNSIRAVGNAGGNGQIHVGIGVQGVGSVDISQNVLSEIGGQQVESTTVGIFGTAPYLGLTLGSNRIFGQLDESEERTDWRAIRIGDLIPDNALDVGDPGAIVAGAVGALPTAPAGSYAFVNVQGDTWAASAEIFAVVLPARTGQVSASANQVRSAQRSIGAIVSIAEPGGTLSFAGNQCDLRSGGGQREVVMLASPAVSAQGNLITHSTDATSLRILTGRAGRATPVGNITSAGLSVHPAGLNAPFDALNLNI
jgi:hypothetical protein